ncbi:MAG: energy transducer TonB [Flavobacteriales bacterium]|nr:energy transducer TonB [Flavobacteriales bacterium]
MRTKNASLERKRPLFFTAGLLLAVSLALVSFEWRTPYTAPQIPVVEPIIDDEVVWVLPIKIEEPEQKLEKPDLPKKQPEPKTEFKIVDEQVSDAADTDEPDLSDDDLTDISGPIEKPVDNDVDDFDAGPITFAAEMPEYCGGEKAMFAFLGEELKYPEIPRQNGVTGTVYVQFVVGKDGKLRDAEVKRSVDPWLDAEALRVAKMLDCFTPGRQGGKNVDVYFILPIRFTLGG